MLWILLIVSAARAQTPELENQWVRVLRVQQAARTPVSLPDRLPSVLVYVTGPKAGKVEWLDAGKGLPALDQAGEVVVTELKPERIHAAKVALDPVKLDPKYHTVPLENDRVRALRTVLEPHIKSPMHEHPAYVVVYLTELHTTMKLADGRLVDNPRRPGEIAWRDPLKHETENIGEHTAVEIQIELK